MNLRFKLLLVCLVSLMISALWLLIGIAPVAAATANSVMTLTYSVQTDRQGNESLTLLAKVAQENGYPLSQRTISFFEKTDLFSDANVPLGSAVTSAVGIASLKYETRVAGPHTFTAVYGGDDNTSSAVVTSTLDLENLPPLPPLSAPTGMEAIARWSMIAAGLVVVIVWGLLIGVFVGTVRGIPAGAKARKQ
jgi:hypothetical protein